MKQVRCNRGHFYDADKFDTCPHCADIHDKVTPPDVTVTKKPSDDGVTVTSFHPDNAPKETVSTPTEPLSHGNDRPGVTMTPPSYYPLDNEPKTVGLFKKDGNPVVGWLVCTKGLHRGEDFRLRSGRNFIGRSSDMDVCLKDESVSRDKHAIVLYEPKQRIFLAQMGESHELVYLNDALLLSSTQMKPRDRLQIGDVELMFIPCCDADFDWLDNEDKE